MTAIESATPTQIRWHEARTDRLARMEPASARVLRRRFPVPVDPAFTPIKILGIEECEPPEAVVVIPALRWRQIVLEVAAQHGVSLPEITGHQRAYNIVRARHEAFYRLKTETQLSLPQIGRKMGGRDHTTVLHGVRKHKERLMEEASG